MKRKHEHRSTATMNTTTPTDEAHHTSCSDPVEEPVKSDTANEKMNDVNSTTTAILPQEPQRPAYILPLIVAAQFAGTSLWFAGNAVLSDLVEDWKADGIIIPESANGHLASVVQLGFIVGTLASALLNLADRFRPSFVFLWSALMGATLNALIPVWKSTAGLIVLRLGTGMALAGIYPVGMKIASDWYPSGLGRALGWLVGALALGSATPFLLQQLNAYQPWQALLWEISGLAVVGGLAVGFLVPDGPFRKPGTKLEPSVVWTMFRDPPFRAAALGYFGHMWEVSTIILLNEWVVFL